ncbi:hypothetical protein CEE37_12095 [candidate division LCP-89 bacterium B3_LCP]|uniref:Anaphase-promoting complex subunit 4 WD40 domain-containing protein n=1 Tax=candidate division LCP-89 bacterium B3_LCP TaxID=2012998 RepID=A0A532UUG0_UNCL8|nr:MAG: hypothetical protein CEE37_12095 [candidate division LCP-89 bacterium B3_LCP]
MQRNRHTLNDLKAYILVLLTVVTAILLLPNEVQSSQPIRINSFKIAAPASDLIIRGGIVIAGTNAGIVCSYDLKNGTLLKQIKLPEILDFMGDPYAPSILSIDYLEDRYLIVAEGGRGSRNIFLYTGDVLEEILQDKSDLLIRKAKFIDHDRILLALVSNELILCKMRGGEEIYRRQVSPSLFSDFDVGDGKSTVAVACESGSIFLLDVATGSEISELQGGNKDLVYDLEYSKGKIITGGKDRLCALYDVDTGSFETYQAEFLVFAVALNPSASWGAFTADESGTVSIISVIDRSITATIPGGGAPMNNLRFIDDTTLLCSSESAEITIWRVGK